MAERLPETAEELAASVAKWLKDGAPSWALDGLSQLTERAAERDSLRNQLDERNRNAAGQFLAQIDLRRAAEARAEAAEDALADVHEYHCGCDRPGNLAACVATPTEAFAALAAARPEQESE